MWRNKDRKGHAGSGLAAGVPVDALHAIVRPVEGNGFDRHDLTAPAPHSDGVAAADRPGSPRGWSPTAPRPAGSAPWASGLAPPPPCAASAPGRTTTTATAPSPL